jgi:hypothetical protein
VTDGESEDDCVDDAVRLRAHVAGDPDAFAELVACHQDRMWPSAVAAAHSPESGGGNVEVPHPLEQSYNWRTPATFASLAAVICVGALLRGRVSGWLPALAVVVGLWALVVGLIYLRTRAYLMVDGSRLTVRRFRNFHTIEAADLVAVNEFLTPNGPCYRLTVRRPDGSTARVVAPVALLRGGHSALFTWVLTRAPQAELDKASLKTVAGLRTQGRIP